MVKIGDNTVRIDAAVCTFVHFRQVLCRLDLDVNQTEVEILRSHRLLLQFSKAPTDIGHLGPNLGCTSKLADNIFPVFVHELKPFLDNVSSAVGRYTSLHHVAQTQVKFSDERSPKATYFVIPQ